MSWRVSVVMVLALFTIGQVKKPHQKPEQTKKLVRPGSNEFAPPPRRRRTRRRCSRY